MNLYAIIPKNNERKGIMTKNNALSFFDKTSLNLMALFESYGYKKYKMSKFEEYDLYLQNKSFLKSENVIAFNDPTGKLLALKPDVTLSIAKNTAENETEPRKLFYSENVYRVSGNMNEFKEMSQIGLEFIGELDLYSLCEVLVIAKKSLAAINDSFVLDISHMGLLIGLLEETDLSFEIREDITEAIGTKNSHETAKICAKYGVADDLTEKLTTLATLYGSIDKILPATEKLVINDTTSAAVEELKAVCQILKTSGQAENINVDLSVVSDLSYYNGITFRGFIENVPGSILSGGRYDNLLIKLGKKASAVGFAVYMDLLSYLDKDSDRFDADVMLVYEEGTPAEKIFSVASGLRAEGLRVNVAASPCNNIKFKKLMRLNSEGVLTDE